METLTNETLSIVHAKLAWYVCLLSEMFPNGLRLLLTPVLIRIVASKTSAAKKQSPGGVL